MLDWSKYSAIADRFQHRAQHQDRNDLRHDVILALAEAERDNGNRQLLDKSMLRIASYECQKFLRRLKRNSRLLSLNTTVEDGDGSTTEIIDTIADDRAIDLCAWLDAKAFLLSCPKRLILLAHKMLMGEPLANKEYQYLWRFRKKKKRRAAPM